MPCLQGGSGQAWVKAKMGDRIKRALFILMRLYHNQAGNTLAIVAAAIFPLAALIGGGVDISRIYLTKTRLQQACDAGALAGRRAMTGLTWTTGQDNGSSEDTANRFFTVNFPANKYGTKSGAVVYSASETGAVTGNATVVVPMTLMSLFQMPDKTVTATCTADLQLPNTDVMFVLDTTLSMNEINTGDSQSRIEVLRSAVSSFYTELENVRPAGSHIRYGFVPYSGTVNVGTLLKPAWLQDNPIYDSREADGTSTQITTKKSGGGFEPETLKSWTNWQTTSGSYGPGTPYYGEPENCVAPAKTLSDKTVQTSWNPNSSALPRSRVHTRTRHGTTYSASLSGGVCTIKSTVYNNLVEERTETISQNPNAGQPIPETETTTTTTHYHWIYRPISYDISALKVTDSNGNVKGNSFKAPVENASASGHPRERTITWNASNGCIEERGSGYDMDVDLVPDPTRPETQWKPYLPRLVYGRDQTTTGYQKPAPEGQRYPTAWLNRWAFSGSPLETKTRDFNLNDTTNFYTPSVDLWQSGACPTAARKLSEIDATTLNAYLDSLTPAGFTYHDIGMLWGLRLMSREGLFAAEHAAAESSGRYARNLIFMTDGQTDTRIGAYDAWGLSAMTRRRTPTNRVPTDEEQNALTETRLTQLCNVAKNQKNITVWVIAFGTELSPLLSGCASPGRAYQADNADQLTATFSQIASQIAQLRVTR
ncbi:Flp pilus assembly protein TadG [Sphingobium herbicidovorans NBRC 16415]|uniref:Flp pilus assembly protein TadG n=2 Tax=Sphingobium herbicidovorans TaxID=76947 RepID=A0A086PCU7_SPHHM|nr:Flp pilus assembly protein TadG [Sphingobium herbicidovorans NBRC 16415]